MLVCELKEWPKEHVWRWVRDQASLRNVVAVPFKGKVFALGAIDDVRACFGENIKEGPRRTPLSEDSLRFEEGAITSLMLEALARSIVSATGMQADRSHEIWCVEAPRQENYEGETYNVHESVQLSLRQIERKLFLILKPSVRVVDFAGHLAPKSKANPIKLRILGWQHNKEFNEAVNLWRSRLLATDQSQKQYEFPPNIGSSFRFLIRRAPAFAEIVASKSSKKVVLEPRFRALVKQRGFQIPEPQLVFANRFGNGMAEASILSFLAPQKIVLSLLGRRLRWLCNQSDFVGNVRFALRGITKLWVPRPSHHLINSGHKRSRVR